MINSIYDLPQRHLNNVKTKVTDAVAKKIKYASGIEEYRDWECKEMVDKIMQYLLTNIYYDNQLVAPTDTQIIIKMKEEIRLLAYDQKYSYFKRYWAKLRHEKLPINHGLRNVADEVEGLFWEDRYGNLELVSAMEIEYIHNIISLLENPKNTWIKKEDNEEWLKIFYQELDLRIDKAFQEQEIGGVNDSQW